VAFRIKLPATSANLGAAFDTAAVALDFHLEIVAEPAERYSIAASGRNAAQCSATENNLILNTYRSTLGREGRVEVPLALEMKNGIPLGMGCGSSAASRLAALALAAHFGELGWSPERILAEACALEGHPDNAAACWLGGLVLAACDGPKVHAARVEPPAGWLAMLVMPKAPLPTSQARAVLPAQYSRADAVANIQAAALLGAALADRIHQPYRARICPLLPLLLPLAGRGGILGVALSGAGPSVLVVISGRESVASAAEAVHAAIADGPEAEILVAAFEPAGCVIER